MFQDSSWPTLVYSHFSPPTPNHAARALLGTGDRGKVAVGRTVLAGKVFLF